MAKEIATPPFDAIRAVVAYNLPTEQRDYEEQDDDGREHHVYRSLLVIEDWLTSAAPVSTEDKRGVIEVHDVAAYQAEHGPVVATCGACGRSWDDSHSTAWTPVPSGRCPFEYEHAEEVTQDEQDRRDHAEIRAAFERNPRLLVRLAQAFRVDAQDVADQFGLDPADFEEE